MPIGINDQSSRYPKRAPATEYVEMPPASLSTVDVIRPGPSTAKKSARRVQAWRPRRRARTTPSRHCSTRSLMATMFKPASSSQLGAQSRHDIVHRYHADGPAAAIHHGQAAQVVLIEQLK